METSAPASTVASFSAAPSTGARAAATADATGTASVDLGALPLLELESQLTELAGHLNAAQHRFLVLLAEFDRRKGWWDGGTRTCAHWLNWQCGIDLGAARERVRVALALEGLPLISAAMACGELSYSKVRALTRVAGPETERELLQVALHGTAQHVEKLVRQFRRNQDREEQRRCARQFENRSVSWSWDDDGSLLLRVRLPAEQGAIVLKALEAAVEAMPPLDVSAETSYRESPTFGMRRADALSVLAESFLAHGAHGAKALSGGVRLQIVVHVDEATLRHRGVGRCELEDGPALATETARRLACDASVVRIVEDENGEPLNVGRKTRSVPPALRRALNSRDQGCRFPGCTHTRYVDAHHVKHWAEGGDTKLSNLLTLCRFHHRKVHEGGIRIERLDDGAWRFVKPSGQAFTSVLAGRTRPLLSESTPESAPPEDGWRDLLAANTAAGFHIDTATARTRWKGERLDYSIATEALESRWRAAGATFPQQRWSAQQEV